MIKKNLVFMGQPGVGKGTVASFLTKMSDIKHISTGNIFRDEIANRTTLGIEVEKIVTTGGYVPDSITNSIVEKVIKKHQAQNQKFILDGYPRTIEQAQFLNSIENLDFIAIELYTDEHIILERLSGRRTCPKCKKGYHIKFHPPKIEGICDACQSPLTMRKDDQPDAVKGRLEIYNQKTKPLIDFYDSQNMLLKIDSSEDPKTIAKKILEKIQ
ncbi:nucleoside monophosphate kinase [Mycoplasma sp. 1578d]|uniref:adenylate kinase family protein n=1 Tax=Mycoplasma sp. 1578d TaxID=2967299 RepID=UPI00211C2FC5|nr:nucleoside monophosphate kinase [Mycoplasma sp. 1578d]UUM19732.1 nucleoside monophosphate kinase [Mycoplasma sp. 1578d]